MVKSGMFADVTQLVFTSHTGHVNKHKVTLTVLL